MSKTVVVYSCAHTKPEVSNSRFDLLGDFLYDLKPDMVFDLGDGADMGSLSSYEDRYPKQVVMQNYGDDIETYLDAQERLRHKFRHMKRKKPFWVGMEGNHEHRIKKALAHDPRLEAKDSNYGISFKHLQNDYWFDDYHEYTNGAPAISTYENVDFAHFFSSGNLGRAISGDNHARSLLTKRHRSSVCGHSHFRNLAFDDAVRPKGLVGLVAGCYKGSQEAWAGQANNGWWKGVVVLHNFEDGMFEPEFVSMKRLEEEYG